MHCVIFRFKSKHKSRSSREDSNSSLTEKDEDTQKLLDSPTHQTRQTSQITINMTSPTSHTTGNNSPVLRESDDTCSSEERDVDLGMLCRRPFAMRDTVRSGTYRSNGPLVEDTSEVEEEDIAATGSDSSLLRNESNAVLTQNKTRCESEDDVISEEGSTKFPGRRRRSSFLIPFFNRRESFTPSFFRASLSMLQKRQQEIEDRESETQQRLEFEEREGSLSPLVGDEINTENIVEKEEGVPSERGKFHRVKNGIKKTLVNLKFFFW